MLTEKKCPRCGEVKPISEFGINRTRKDGHTGYCKVCTSEVYPAYKQKYRAKKPPAYVNEYQNNRERNLRNTKNYQASRLELLWSLKTPCLKCGETRKYSIDFHHIDPATKTITLSSPSVGKAKILNEVNKCVCLCKNCHSEFHYIYGHRPENPVEALREYLGGNLLDEATRKQA